MSAELVYRCDADIDADSTCGRTIRVPIVATEGPQQVATRLRALGWSGTALGPDHRCDRHSGVPPIPARVPSALLDVPPGTPGVPLPQNVTPIRPRRRT